MNLSREWLSEFVDILATDKEYDDAMTMSGSKVELTTRLDAEIENVVVGRVLSMKRHENSDHMWICQVDVGENEPVQIVTGAQNVREGDLCPVAKDGSRLPGGVEIKAGKLRGVESWGMLCSLKELGLDIRDFPYAIEDGIFILQEDCHVGQDICEVVGFDDSVVEFEITNNRPDCLGVIGLARETAATFNVPLRLHEPVVQGSGGDINDSLSVEIRDKDLCSRYVARMVTDIHVEPSPKWMRRRLRAMGVRPINNIVDITNYVMLEYGQPMHAFDYNYVEGGKIVVRRAGEDKETFTLDGQARALTPNMLVIADEHRPVGIAGVMGGLNSEITGETRAIVFESACFNGPSVRTTAVKLNLRTDASGRFEKGLDPENCLPAIQRACELVELLGAGKVVDGIIDVRGETRAPVTQPLHPEKINRLLGLDVSADYMKSVLAKIGFGIDGDMITAPSWRADIECNADLAEEVARFYGYDRIPTTMFRGETEMGKLQKMTATERKLGVLCRAVGYSEILTYSFVSPRNADKMRWAPDSPLRSAVKIINPLGEDTSVMRTSALPSMMEVLQRNNSYRNKAVKFYETGKVYLPVEGQDLLDEPTYLTLGFYGGGDFFSLKGEAEAILRGMNTVTPEFRAITNDPGFHPGRCAGVYMDGVEVGRLGQIHPLTAANYDLDMEVYAAQFNVTEILNHIQPDPSYHPLPRFPAMTRDIAVVCDAGITVAELERCIYDAGGEYLESCELFDVYTGSHIAEGKKSVAFSLVLRARDQTLTDDHAQETVDAVLEALETRLGAVIR